MTQNPLSKSECERCGKERCRFADTRYCYQHVQKACHGSCQPQQEQINYMHVLDESHCLTCHETYVTSKNDHPEDHRWNPKPTACMASCGKYAPQQEKKWPPMKELEDAAEKVRKAEQGDRSEDWESGMFTTLGLMGLNEDQIEVALKEMRRVAKDSYAEGIRRAREIVGVKICPGHEREAIELIKETLKELEEGAKK